MESKNGQEKVEKQFQEDMLSGMWEWRLQHPKASFVEIEAEMEVRIARLRAKMLEELIAMSSAADWAEGEVVHCPQCGAAMERGGKQKRGLQGSGGSEIEIEREYAECPACGAGFFPSG
jgi:ribosomal protein S27AE